MLTRVYHRLNSNGKSSRPEVFYKKGVLRNFTKVACRPATLLKKRLWHRYFPMNFAKFLTKPFLRTPLVAASEGSKRKANI